MEKDSRDFEANNEGLIEVKRPLICIPIVSKNRQGLMEQAAQATMYGADIIEWRADGFERPADKPAVSCVLAELKNTAGKTPIVFTCRSARERGIGNIPENLRIQLVSEAIETGLADIVDIELITGAGVIEQIRKLAHRYGTKLIISTHDYCGTPKEAIILDRIEKAKKLGADIAKVAVMANNQEDILRLLGAAYRAKAGGTDIPIAAMAMGRLGALSRITAGFFGSDIVYASGKVCSAQGQIPIWELNSLWRGLYNSCGRRDVDDYSDECPCK